MNWKYIITGVIAGVTAGYVTQKIISENHSLNSNEVLAIAKSAFKQQGPITGSWIQMEEDIYDTGDSSISVFKGGITRMNGDNKESFAFISNSKTGEIIDAFPIEQ